MKEKTNQIRRALREKLLISFRPAREDRSVVCYVLDIGPRFFLVAEIYDCVAWQGYSCYQFSDVRHLQAPDRYAAFVESALKARRQHLQRKPRVKLRTLKGLLLSAGRAFPLVTIFREKIKPGVCHIGRVVDVTDRELLLLEIAPGAKWDRKPTEYKLSEITRVEFGGPYEEGLHLVGGPPPSK